MTDYSPLLSSIQGKSIDLAYSDSNLYIAGFKSTQAAPQPLLIQINPRTLNDNDLPSIAPSNFCSVGGIATDSEMLLLAGGAFLSVAYDTITCLTSKL